MHAWRASWLLATLVAGLLLSAPASAQVVSIASGTQGVARHHEIPDLRVNYINRQNCLDNESITFHLKVTSGPSVSFRLGAWVGSGCEVKTNRSGGNATCRRIGADIAWQMATDLSLNVQDIIAAVNTTAVAVADAGTDADAGSDTDAGTTGNVAACDGSGQPVGFTINFLLVDSSNDEPTGYTAAKWEGKFDLKGPDAPTGVTAGVGENRLVVSWTPAAGTVTSEIDGYFLFCDPPAGAGTPVDGGSTDCAMPVQSDAAACGSVTGGTATSTETSALTNGVTYGVSVAGRDTFKNYGELSESTCAAPEPVTGFFEAYRAAGGEGGGGFCSIGAGRSSAVAGFVTLALLGLALRRRAANREKKGPVAR